jgi:hypothetical protein
MTDYINGNRPIFYVSMIVKQAVTLCKRNHGAQTRIDLQEQVPRRLPREFEEYTRMYTYICTFHSGC